MDIVYLRSKPASMVTKGGLLIPGHLAAFYYGMPRGKYFYATVLAVGPKCKIKAGVEVICPRIDFAWVKVLDDGTLVGWVRERDLLLEVTVSPPPEEPTVH